MSFVLFTSNFQISTFFQNYGPYPYCEHFLTILFYRYAPPGYVMSFLYCSRYCLSDIPSCCWIGLPSTHILGASRLLRFQIQIHILDILSACANTSRLQICASSRTSCWVSLSLITRLYLSDIQITDTRLLLDLQAGKLMAFICISVLVVCPISCMRTKQRHNVHLHKNFCHMNQISDI